jgi:hypothetical protein
MSNILGIPGKNRGEAVVMGDHYDTAYMEDYYYDWRGGDGSRIGAHGADDNDSATATLLQGAPIFLWQRGQVRTCCVHPPDGRRVPSIAWGRGVLQALIENTKLLATIAIDLSGDESGGRLSDGYDYTTATTRAIFQISPQSEAFRLAYSASGERSVECENSRME